MRVPGTGTHHERLSGATRERRAPWGAGAARFIAPLVALMAGVAGNTSRLRAAEAGKSFSLPKATMVGGPSAEFEPLEKQMWAMVNRERSDPDTQAETGEAALALQWDDRLAEVAREHSRDMAARGYFSHVAPDGSTPDSRVTRAEIEWQGVGENIAEYGDVARAEAAFMNEPRFAHNHRHNILNPKFTHVGVGIARGADGMFYITQEFAAEP